MNTAMSKLVLDSELIDVIDRFDTAQYRSYRRTLALLEDYAAELCARDPVPEVAWVHGRQFLIAALYDASIARFVVSLICVLTPPPPTRPDRRKRAPAKPSATSLDFGMQITFAPSTRKRRSGRTKGTSATPLERCIEPAFPPERSPDMRIATVLLGGLRRGQEEEHPENWRR